MAKPTPNLGWLGKTVGGRYKIEAFLDQGGMSTVYKASDPNLHRTVALKIIHPYLTNDKDFVRRFEQEATAVAKLRHPNIIQVYDFNHENDIYYMVLDYVAGQTLKTKLKLLSSRGQRLPTEELIQIMNQTCQAVAYAHEQGMIHRDLKPANVMLTPEGQAILMDFGVAKMLSEEDYTATGTIIGTAKYMSPEQARGERPDARSDVYALGVILYEMVAGKPPFDADSTVALMMKHVKEPVPDIRRIQSDVPNELVEIIDKALAKDPKERYQSAAHMAAAIKLLDRLGQTNTPLSDAHKTVPAKTRPGTQPLAKKSEVSGLDAAPLMSAPKLQPAQSSTGGSRQLLIIGAATVVLLIILGLGAFFAIDYFLQPTVVDEEALALSEALPSAEGMVQIDGDVYTVGLTTSDKDHASSRQVELSEFWIDQREVTNAQYAAFLAQTDNQSPPAWPTGGVLAEEEEHPVKGLTWEMAGAYCGWANKRLPTEAEWEVAARGVEARLYPWGDNPSAVQLPVSGTYVVGSKTTNQSPFGLFDMAGNVWEWVAEPYAPVPEGHQVLRGGSNDFLTDMAYRLQGDPNVPTMYASAGLRCAANQVNLFEAETLEANVFYEDSFDDPGSGWPILSEGVFYFGYHPPDFYHIEVGTVDRYTVVSRQPEFDNVTVEAEVLVNHTDTETGDFRYGLVVRRSGEDQFYAFAISHRSESWAVLKKSPLGLEVLAQGAVDTLQGFAPPGFAPDKADTLRADTDGPEFTFHINGQTVARVIDSDYASGEVGLFVENFDETLAHVHFDSLFIHRADEEALALAPTVTPEPLTPTLIPTPEPTSTPTVTPEPSTSTPTPTPEPTSTPTVTPEPPTLTLTPTPQPTSTPTPTPEPTVSPTAAVPDGMVLVPAGYFLMGSSSGEVLERPEHPVFLDAFYIDQFEVTNAQYRECVLDLDCTQGGLNSFTRQGYRDAVAYDDYPVIAVTWDQANAYCAWAGKHLPSEAQWEYAASGPRNYTWPWGNTFDAKNTAAGAPDTQPVGSYPAGASVFGVNDLAGNVNEWVADEFYENYYAESPPSNPLSQDVSAGRIFRGGSFDNGDGSYYTTSRRYGNIRTFSDADVGFRCALNVPEITSAEERALLVADFCELYTKYRSDAACP